MGDNSYEQDVTDALSVEILSITDLKHYFPDAEIVRERFAGLIKSIIAAADGRAGERTGGRGHHKPGGPRHDRPSGSEVEAQCCQTLT